MSLTILWNAWTQFTFKCPSQWCQNSSAWSFLHDCTKLAAYVLCTLLKFISYKLQLRSFVTITSPSRSLTIHSFRLLAFSTHWTKICSLRANLLATTAHEGHPWYELSRFYQQQWNPFRLLSWCYHHPNKTIYGAITSYVLNVIIWEVMWLFQSPWSSYTLPSNAFDVALQMCIHYHPWYFF